MPTRDWIAGMATGTLLMGLWLGCNQPQKPPSGAGTDSKAQSKTEATASMSEACKAKQDLALDKLYIVDPYMCYDMPSGTICTQCKEEITTFLDTINRSLSSAHESQWQGGLVMGSMEERQQQEIIKRLERIEQLLKAMRKE